MELTAKWAHKELRHRCRWYVWRMRDSLSEIEDYTYYRKMWAMNRTVLAELEAERRVPEYLQEDSDGRHEW